MAEDSPKGTFFFRKTKIKATTTTTTREAADAIVGSKNLVFSFGLHELSVHKFGFPSSLQKTCN